MELVDYLRLLLRSWVTIIVCSLLGIGLATAYLLAQPVLYSASSSSYVSLSSVRDVSDAAAGSSFAQTTATNLAELAGSPYVLNNVRRTLRISTPVSTLQQQVQAQVPAQSAVVQVTATTTQPSLSSALANAVTTELGYAVERLTPNAGNAASIARATTISRATTPTAPVSPTVLFDLAVGLLGGFGVGVLSIGADRLDGNRRQNGLAVPARERAHRSARIGRPQRGRPVLLRLERAPRPIFMSHRRLRTFPPD